MADYSAKIKLIVEGLQSLKQVEDRVKSLNRLAAVDLSKALTGIKGFGSVKKEVDGVADSFSRLGKIVRGLAVGTGLGALTTSINGLSQAATALKFGGISKFAAALAAATGPAAELFKELSSLAIQFPVVAGTATIAGAALLAFAPQVLRAGNATVRLGKAAAEAGQPLSRLMASLAGSGFRVDMLIDAAQAAEIYKNRIYELSETVSVLSRRQTALKNTLDRFNSDSETAAKIAVKLVDVTKRLNAEQQAQNDLLREAAGLRSESVERRATNTYNVTQRRKTFEAAQASDLETLNESLRRLENRQINWADALGIDATEGAARNADRLSQAWTKNQQALNSWKGALREGGQWLEELQTSMRTDTADAYTRALLNQQRTLDAYTDSAAQARRAIEGLGYAGETPALRPAGFTDQDVRIKNLLDDQETAAKTIFNLENEFNKQVHFTELEFIRKELEAEIDKIEAIGAAQKKADSAALKDFDARLKGRTEKSARRRAMTENVIIGGAFPMLFGGGPGAVLGGAAGGLIPGNPMLSVATSAVGALVDQFVASVAEAGSAMRDPITNFQKLADSGLIASRSQKLYIERLIEAGRVTEAAAVIQEEITKKIGAQGVKDLQNAGAASDSFNKKLAELNLQMQAAVAGPLTDLLTWLNKFLAGVVSYNRQQAAQTDFLTSLREANPQAYQQYFKESMRLRQANGGNVDVAAVQQLQQQYTQRFNLQPGAVASNIDKTPELKAKAQTEEMRAQVKLEAEKLTLVGMSLEKNGQAYKDAAKAVALQEYKNRLLEIQNSWIGQAYDAERNTLLIRQANLQYAGKLKAIDAERVKAGREQRDILSSIYGLQIELIQTSLAGADADVASTAARLGEIESRKELQRQQSQRLLLETRILDIQLAQKLLAKDLTAQERDLLVKIYEGQKANLLTQAQTKDRLLRVDIARLEIARQIAALEGGRRLEDIRQQRGQELAGLQFQLAIPFGGEAAALLQQQLDQQTRRYETLIPLERQLEDAQLERSQIAQDASIAELAAADRKIEDKKAEIELEKLLLTQLDATEAKLLQQQQVYQKYGFIADEVSRALSDSISGLITGTTTVAEAFSRMFESIGKAFIDMATQLLAQKLFMTVISAIAGPSFGATDSRGFSFPMLVDAFAEGGFVTGPTNAVIGEGGEPEYVIPASKMRGAMNRYSAGARGSSVIPSDSGDGPSAGGTMTAAPIDVRYTVERINSVDYVTADQFQAGMRQAASQGAERGQQLALRRLQQSPSTRRRVGI